MSWFLETSVGFVSNGEQNGEIIPQKSAASYNHDFVDPKAMAKLEEQFKNKMLEVAELQDQREELEHKLLQLQHETDTISKYNI